MMLDMHETLSGFWPQNVMPLVKRTKFTSTDLGAVHDHMTKIFCDHDLHVEGGAPPLTFRHNHVALRSMTFSATDYGTPYGRVAIGIPPMEELFLVQFTLTGCAQITHQNATFDLLPGHMCVLSSHAPTRQVLNNDYKHFTIKIARSDLEQVLAGELGYRPKSLSFSPQPVPLTGAAAAFAHMVRTICDDIDNGSVAYTHPRAVGAIEETLRRLLLAAVPHNHSEIFNTPPTGPAPYYIRRVEEFIRANAGDPITITDMIEISGVSARSLHTGFRRFRGDTPMGYLKRYRLELAHQMLERGMEQGQSVTEVALASGFSHLSKFARDYADRYGCRPSDTLKKLRSS